MLVRFADIDSYLISMHGFHQQSKRSF